MNNGQLRLVMRYYLDHFNRNGVAITDDTVHNTILSDSDGFPPANSMNLYKGSVTYSLKMGDNGTPDWPDAWMDTSVAQLADNFIPRMGAAAIAPTRPAAARTVLAVGAPSFFKEALGQELVRLPSKRTGGATTSPRTKKAAKTSRSAGKAAYKKGRRSKTGKKGGRRR
jgi:hypothetical protein